MQRAEDLRVANNLTLFHRTDTDAFVKPSQQPMGPVAAFSKAPYHIEMAEEYRNQNLYGHLCLLNLERLILPIGTGPEIAGDDSVDYPINRTAILTLGRKAACRSKPMAQATTTSCPSTRSTGFVMRSISSSRLITSDCSTAAFFCR